MHQISPTSIILVWQTDLATDTVIPQIPNREENVPTRTSVNLVIASNDKSQTSPTIASQNLKKGCASTSNNILSVFIILFLISMLAWRFHLKTQNSKHNLSAAFIDYYTRKHRHK
ncbi:MAG: hypothetical protein JW841_15275 [Deltaproteobacteria bacterium]|nr:hypothetical protein [Deltaproteobacteria bacterium]